MFENQFNISILFLKIKRKEKRIISPFSFVLVPPVNERGRRVTCNNPDKQDRVALDLLFDDAGRILSQVPRKKRSVNWNNQRKRMAELL